MQDNKKAVSMILAGMGPEKGEMEPDQGTDMHAIAQEIIEAVEKKDVLGLASALHAFMECGETEEGGQQEGQEEEQHEE